jgi:RND superfamily putative drug exporter
MFATISRFADRYRLQLLIAWVALAVIVTLVAPNLDDVTDNDQRNFLPDDASALTAQALIEQHFPQNADQGSLVLVFESADGTPITNDTDAGYMAEISTWLIGPDAPAHIHSVLSPSLTPEAAGSLIAPDQQAAMIVVTLDTTLLDEREAVLDSIGQRVEDAPASLNVYRTGETAIGAEYNATLTESVDRTIFVTLALVVIILLVIYRSPVSPLIPLGVVTIAFMIARGIVAWLAQDVFTVTDTASMLLIVVMYGAGTDYCLFLISRFREEMADRDDSRESVRRTVRRVGESISSSAGTVVVGFMAMTMAQLGLFNTTGPTLAIGIVVSLLAGLTLTPALLGLLGRRAFWPARAQHRNAGAFYRRTSQLVAERPLLTVIVIALLMSPFAYWGSRMQVTYDFLADLPDDTESVEGFRVLETHIGAGEMQPLTAVSVFEGDLLADVDAMTQRLQAVDGVATVRSATQPLGADNAQTAGITRIDRQLGALAAILTPAEGAAAQPTPEQAAMMDAFFADLPAYLTLVAERAPALAQSDEYASVMAALAGIGEGTASAADLANALGALAQVGTDQHLDLAQLPAGVAALFGGEQAAAFVDSFLNTQTNAARFEIVLADAPYSATAMDTVDHLKGVLSGQGAVYGSTAVNADIRDYLHTDQRNTIALVLAGIFIILMLMLRSIVAPVYLISTILLSYGTTLGITRLASSVLWGTDELTWWVPFFMFVFLVALGIDYSIFLFGRIKEEVGRRGIHDGIHDAVQSTGSIITSAGIIVAGTFGAMMAGSILGLAQIGFAVSVGILIDTFVVRTILDPALASLFGRWTWWPGRVAPAPRATSTQERNAVPARDPGSAD